MSIRLDAARAQLAALGVETMAPFTDFSYLRQAFTRGELWPVDPQRIQRLLDAGQITAEQATRFRHEGALGSHMEIEIITRTDPRRAIGA
jgi:hypothetical protein